MRLPEFEECNYLNFKDGIEISRNEVEVSIYGY